MIVDISSSDEVPNNFKSFFQFSKKKKFNINNIFLLQYCYNTLKFNVKNIILMSCDYVHFQKIRISP